MKSKDLIAMGIIAAAALSINGMTASADEVSADTSYEAAAPSYSDSGNSDSSSSSSGASGSGSSASSSSSSSASSDRAGSSSSSSSSSSAGFSSSGSSLSSASSDSSSSSSDSAGSSGSNSSSGSEGSSSSGTASGSGSSSGSDAGSSSGSADSCSSGSGGYGSASDSSGTGVIDSDLSGTGNSDSESGSSDSNSVVSTFGSGSDSSDTDSASSGAADSETSEEDVSNKIEKSNSNSDKPGSSSDEETHEDQHSTDSEAAGQGENISGISGGSDKDPSADGSSETASGNTSGADLPSGNTSGADLPSEETITDTQNNILIDENGTDEHTDEETSALSDASMPENTDGSPLSLTVGDSLFTTEAKLTEADSNILMESAGDTEEIQPDPTEPDKNKVYKSLSGFSGTRYFAYDETAGSWKYYDDYDENSSEDSGYVIENFKIIDAQGIYSYDEKDADGTVTSYLAGVNEYTEKYIPLMVDAWDNVLLYLYDGKVYDAAVDRLVDSVPIDRDRNIYGLYSQNYYKLNNEESEITAIVGWKDQDVTWLGSYKEFFLYNNNLYYRDMVGHPAGLLKIQKASEDNTIIWFTDPYKAVGNNDEGVRITGWKDTDITWVNEEAGVFKLNLNSRVEFLTTPDNYNHFAL